MRLAAFLVAALTVALSASAVTAHPGGPGLGLGPQLHDGSLASGSPPSVGDKNHTQGHKKRFRGSGSWDADVDDQGLGFWPDGSWDGSGSFPGPHHHKKHHCGPPHPRFNGSFDGSFHGSHHGSFHGCGDGSNSTEATVQAANASSTTSPAPQNAKQISAVVSIAMAAVYLLV